MSLCPLRRVRIFGVSPLFDTILTVIALWVLFFLVQIKIGKLPIRQAWWKSFLLAVLATFPLAIVMHTLFGIATPLNCRLHLATPAKCVRLANAC